MRQEHAGDDNRQYELQDAETDIGTERQQHVAAGSDLRANLVQRPAEVVRRQPPELVQRLADQRPLGKARRSRRYGEAAVDEAGGHPPGTLDQRIRQHHRGADEHGEQQHRDQDR